MLIGGLGDYGPPGCSVLLVSFLLQRVPNDSMLSSVALIFVYFNGQCMYPAGIRFIGVHR